MNIDMGIRIQRLRDNNDLTREELAEKVGLSEKFLYEVERGKKGISADNLLKIAQALSSSCDYILTGQEGVKEIKQESKSVLELFDQKQLKKMEKIIELIHELCNDMLPSSII